MYNLADLITWWKEEQERQFITITAILAVIDDELKGLSDDQKREMIFQALDRSGLKEIEYVQNQPSNPLADEVEMNDFEAPKWHFGRTPVVLEFFDCNMANGKVRFKTILN
ncbi:hypothetical protein JYT72_03230 [Crocinitomix catalasitica]|nr:hypothetical protein [Crocinitomix catalasitica]